MKKTVASERLYNLERLGAFAMLVAILTRDGEHQAARQIIDELMEQMELDEFYWTLIPRLQCLSQELGYDLRLEEETITREMFN